MKNDLLSLRPTVSITFQAYLQMIGTLSYYLDSNGILFFYSQFAETQTVMFNSE